MSWKQLSLPFPERMHEIVEDPLYTTCPACGGKLEVFRCKLVCTGGPGKTPCRYFMGCSEYD